MADKPSPMPASKGSEGTMLPPTRRPSSFSSSSRPSSASAPSSSSSSHTRATVQPYPFAASLASYGENMASQSYAQTPPFAVANAAATPPGKATQTQGKMDLNTLMSPPDQVMDNFPQEGQNTMGPLFAPANVKTSSQPLPMSPPHSPVHRTLDPPRSPRAESVRPPPHLLRRSQNFMYDLEHTHRQAIEQHRREHPLESDLSGPSDHDYLLTLSFRSKIMDHYRENPRNWLRRNLEQVRHDNSLIAQRYPNIMPARAPINNNMTAPPRPTRAPRADRVTKPSAGPRAIRTAGGPTRTSPGPGKRSTSRASATPEPSRRTVAPNREDKDFASIPDLGPDPWETLSGGNALKVEWKGQPLDLSADPHAHLLHPAELALASNLRLDCATYLTSKRRIFERRLACIKQPKEFRKTDAQQACKIDVNKASKLWQAFDKVGWLEERWMDKHLDKP